MAKQETHRRAIYFPVELDERLRRLARRRSLEDDRDVSVTALVVEAAERLLAEESGRKGQAPS